jgi:hypothetical protein
MPLEDIEALLNEADESLAEFEGIYQETLAAKKQGYKLKPKMKGILEHQRSALDYLAHEIRERDGTKNKAKTYYPSAHKPQDFNQRIGACMPGVRQARPDIAAAIERHQAYQPGHEWLQWLYDLANENKHRVLSPLQPDEGTRYEFDGLTVITSSRTKLKHPTLGSEISVEEMVGQHANASEGVWVDWMLTKPHRPLLQTLQEIQAGVRAVVADVAQVARL